MIQTVMLVALGFFLASLLMLLFAGPFWRRAVRLTAKRLEATMPMSISDIQAEKDQVRAEYAIRIRRLEIAHDREKENAARYLVERNKHKVTIAELNNALKSMNDQLAERNSANTVLEQTVQKKIPELREQLERARQIIAARDRELVRMTTAYENQTEALTIAKAAAQRYNEEIDRLRVVLESGGEGSGRRTRRGGATDEALVEQNNALQAQVSRLRQHILEQRENEIAGNAVLKAEMHRLAKHMMDGTPPARADVKKAAAEKTAPARKSKKQPTARTTAKKPARSRARSATGKKPGTSLTDRLKKLAAREKV